VNKLEKATSAAVEQPTVAAPPASSSVPPVAISNAPTELPVEKQVNSGGVVYLPGNAQAPVSEDYFRLAPQGAGRRRQLQLQQQQQQQQQQPEAQDEPAAKRKRANYFGCRVTREIILQAVGYSGADYIPLPALGSHAHTHAEA
jgi:hypothetical protein